MKFLKYNLFTLLTAVLFMGASATVYAQTDTGAYDAYNNAIDFASAGKYQQAIDAYKKAISLGEGMGTKGQDIVQNSKEALPKLYYQSALNVYKTFQQSPGVSKLDEAISAFKTAVQQANTYGNADIAGQAKGVITQLYYQKSILQYKQGDYSGALASVNTAIERNPDYAKAYYHKALIINKQESSSVEDYLAAVEKAIQVAESTGNTQIVTSIKEGAASQLVYNGSQQVQNKNYTSAISILKKALKYDPESVNAYYRLAQAANAQANWNEGLTYANKALEYANGGRASQAKIYFALGSAYQGLGQYDKACEAFSNAAYGAFKRSAEHTMEFVLKCKE